MLPTHGLKTHRRRCYYFFCVLRWKICRELLGWNSKEDKKDLAASYTKIGITSVMEKTKARSRKNLIKKEKRNQNKQENVSYLKSRKGGRNLNTEAKEKLKYKGQLKMYNTKAKRGVPRGCYSSAC